MTAFSALLFLTDMEWIIVSVVLLLAVVVCLVVIFNQRRLLDAEKEKFESLRNDFAVAGEELAVAKAMNDRLQKAQQEQERQNDARQNELKAEIEKQQMQFASELERQYRQQKEDFESRQNELKAELEKQQLRFAGEIEKQRQELKEGVEKRQEQLKTEFNAIADTILKARSEELVRSNDDRLNLLLKPFAEKIVSFQSQVEKAFDLEMRDKISLREEVKRLTLLNEQMSREANNLTKALKGDVKQQGNWGEVVLERVLESSGLREGYEFEREVVVEDSEGKVQRPDVVIKLPDDKHIIIDSKMTLVAYERYVSATDEAERERFKKEHIASVRNHIKGLSDKHYENAVRLNTPDFVLLFMPVEGAFALALQTETDLYSYAWERKIVLVSPSTLLATLRTVASIWKQENQTRNAVEIARLGGVIYDKLVDMLDDFHKINNNLEKAQKSYSDAMNKLSDGRGNIFITADKMKTLGAKASKQLNQ